MPKRPRENLARTDDGSAYNKLQRPDNWPVEPPRRSTPETRDDSDRVNTSSDEEQSNVARKPKSKQPRQQQQRKGKSTEYGCLPVGDEDFSGSDNGEDISFAAIQYLKSVRAEASDLPIVHADPAYQAEQEDDHRGYFEDGAYTAAPELGPEYPDYYDEEDWDVPEDGDNTADGRSNHISHITPCEAFTNALLSRYRQLREVIQSQKADMVPGMPSDSTRLVVPRGMARRDKDIWKRKLLSETPQPSVLVTTSLSSISNLLVVAKDECLSRKQNIGKSVSLWFLALLASIDEATVDSDIMWELRDLAKKAIWLRIDFEPRFEAASDAMGQEAGYIKGTESSETNAPSSDRHNTSSVLASEVGPSTKQDEDGEILDDLLLDEDIPNDATKATLDMIVVIVGEVFGQRDLLESRTAVDWPALEEEVNGDEWAVDEDEDG